LAVGVLAAGILNAAGLVRVGAHLVLASAVEGNALGIGCARGSGTRELELAGGTAYTVAPDASGGNLGAVRDGEGGVASSLALGPSHKAQGVGGALSGTDELAGGVASRRVEAAVGHRGTCSTLWVVAALWLASGAAVVAGSRRAISLGGRRSSAVLDGTGAGVVVPLACWVSVAGGLAEESIAAGGLARSTGCNALSRASTDSELTAAS